MISQRAKGEIVIGATPTPAETSDTARLRFSSNQAEAATLLGVTQPRISDLMRGKIDLFGLDTLVNMVTAAGMHIDLKIRDAA